VTSVLSEIQDRRVEEVRPGLWSIPVPIPNTPLGHTLVYCYDTPEGPVLIDTGWDADEAFDALVSGLKEAGFELSTCYGVLVTHFHPDHHGLSGRVRRDSGAWVAMRDERVSQPGRPTDSSGRPVSQHPEIEAMPAPRP
jgi:glyoxylase-like metal-dependent hydrolase (beta-lactamase superfamily II)